MTLDEARAQFARYMRGTEERLPRSVPVMCIMCPLEEDGELDLSRPAVIWPAFIPDEIRSGLLAHLAKCYGPDGELLREHRP